MEKKYEKCISLGWACGTASSMGHLGLRGHSGPFDWYFSDFESVLQVMRTDFSDFMKKENLMVDKDDSTVFWDTKYGFCCNHDIRNDFEIEYPSIYQKYMRRAEHFIKDVQKPTCFIRAVRSEQEIQFIEENEKYIRRIIKKGNSDNEIVFLVLKDMRGLSDNCNFLWFRLGITEYIGQIYEMRTMFETSDSLSKYCRENILSEEVLNRNIVFDREHMSRERKFNVFINGLTKGNYDIISVLRDFYPDIEQKGIYLWGMGTYGVPMVGYFQKKEIRINAIIDNDFDKIGTFWNSIPIIAFSEIEQISPNIFIAIESEQVTGEIMEQIAGRYQDIRIYKMSDLFGHPLVLKLL